MVTLAALLKRAEKASKKAEDAGDASRDARFDLNKEARRIAWAALAKRGVNRGDRIGFIDPKRARWHDRAPQLEALEAYRSRDDQGNQTWRVRLCLRAVNARGKLLVSPLSEYFDFAHPRDIARQIVKAMDGPPAEVVWQSDCGKAHVEERSGMFRGYVGPDHVCTQLSKDRAVDIVKRKMTR